MGSTVEITSRCAQQNQINSQDFMQIKMATGNSESRVPMTLRDSFFNDDFFRNSWEDFDKLRQQMTSESQNFWKRAEQEMKMLETSASSAMQQGSTSSSSSSSNAARKESSSTTSGARDLMRSDSMLVPSIFPRGWISSRTRETSRLFAGRMTTASLSSASIHMASGLTKSRLMWQAVSWVWRPSTRRRATTSTSCDNSAGSILCLKAARRPGSTPTCPPMVCSSSQRPRGRPSRPLGPPIPPSRWPSSRTKEGCSRRANKFHIHQLTKSFRLIIYAYPDFLAILQKIYIRNPLI